MDIIVVSIGTLSKNPMWGEKTPVRTSHATTTLVRSKKDLVLVDPSLPAQALEARLFERAGLAPAEITHIFLTNWRPAHRRALPCFERARWFMHGAEIDAAQRALEEIRARAGREESNSDSAEMERLLASEETLLRRVEEAPDELAEEVDLFPLHGYTPGQCGLLVTAPTTSVMIAGDAVPTAEHFVAGQVFPDCWDVEQAKDSLREMYEIADMIVPGHDNIFLVPRAAGM
jgi:glyoxylase-like metal-dependent hydrolase (beta-lactamase superfamily II)